MLARAFSPRHGNLLLAAAVWLPFLGQLVAARCYGGAAATGTGTARAVALLLDGSPKQRAALMSGALGGVATLGLAVLTAALAYINLADVITVAAAAPVWVIVALFYTAAATMLWTTRHSLGHHHPQPHDVTRIGTLAAWPKNRGAGLHRLGLQLCALADEQQVSLDLVARSPGLTQRCATLGFTRPDPSRLWMVRQEQRDPSEPRPG